VTTFNAGGGRVINVSPSPGLRLLGLGIVVLVIVILFFASVARVESGHVGVLTLFGRVTGEVLPEGIHIINPFNANNEMSIGLKKSKSLPACPPAKAW